MEKYRQSIGKQGETKAKNYLKRRGYQILESNYRTKAGEIDLIAQNRKYLVFVEVKLRKSDRFAMAREYVDSRKQEKLQG